MKKSHERNLFLSFIKCPWKVTVGAFHMSFVGHGSGCVLETPNFVLSIEKTVTRVLGVELKLLSTWKIFLESGPENEKLIFLTNQYKCNGQHGL